MHKNSKFGYMKNTLILICSLSLLCAACSYTLKIKDGKTAFERKQYAVATKLLEKEFGKAKSRSEKNKIALMLGKSYLQTQDFEKASTLFKNAYEGGAGTEALQEYAYSLKRAEKYAEASENFKNLGLEIGSPYEYRREIQACQTAPIWQNDAQYSGVKITLEGFNSKNTDFSPHFFNKNLVFSSDRSAAKGDEIYNWTGNKFFDIFVHTEGGDIQNFEALNTAANEASAVFTANGNEVFFVKSGNEGKNVDVQFQKLYHARLINGNWTTPEVLSFCKERVQYISPAISQDGKTLIFAAIDPEGWGGLDLYEVRRRGENFDEPRLINRTINTVGNEAYPSFDGDTLYFASDYHLGMGGFDIFKTYRLADGTWATPQNLRAPFNSGADDFGLVIDHFSPLTEGVFRQGYFTSNRPNGKGSDDIYRFEQGNPLPRPKQPTIDTSVVVVSKPKEIIYKNILNIIVLEKIFAIADNPNSRILGKKPLQNARLIVNFNGKKQEIQTDTEGGAKIELSENTDYAFLGTKEGYLNSAANFTSKGLGKEPENPIRSFDLEIVLDKIYKDKEITLDNIYYDLNKWDIRDDAQPTLLKLAEVLKTNPNTRIQLSSHTDCRSSDDYNQTLSQKRAESAVSFLIAQGINPDRLVARGYGESQPTTLCDCRKCTEEEHQANRRTTFKILE